MKVNKVTILRFIEVEQFFDSKKAIEDTYRNTT